jgi:hypothetical protein
MLKRGTVWLPGAIGAILLIGSPAPGAAAWGIDATASRGGAPAARWIQAAYPGYVTENPPLVPRTRQAKPSLGSPKDLWSRLLTRCGPDYIYAVGPSQARLTDFRGVHFSRRRMRLTPVDRSHGITRRIELTLEARQARFRYLDWGPWYERDALTVVVQDRSGTVEYAVQGGAGDFAPLQGASAPKVLCTSVPKR